MNNRKQRIYEILELSKQKDIASHSYDMLILVAVIVGILPLTIKGNNIYAEIIDIITAFIFLVDYFARIYTADYKMGIKNYRAYIAYAFSPMAIIDLLSVVPILALLPVSSTAYGVLKLFRIFRIFRVLKLIRYSKTMVNISNVLRRVKKQLVAVLLLVLVYIISVAMLMFSLEPDLFQNFGDAIYWSAVSITTIGYGDIAPSTEIGRFVTIISALVGVAVIALPTGIITAAYTDEIRRVKGKHEL